MYRLFLAALLVFLAAPAFAQTLKGEYNDWAFFQTKDKDSKVCYITANPSKKTGNYKKRGDVYMLVSYRGKLSKPEVSLDSGFPYKKDSDVDFNIDGKKSFKFFTSDKTPKMAWGKDEEMDRSAIEAMKKGNKVTVKSISSAGTKATDTYSLKGFNAAYSKMLSSCN